MAIENSIIFGGVNSADFGIYISGEGVFNAPKRDVEMITIPGRNGEFALDQGRFENITVTYPAFNFEPNDYDTFAQNLSDFRNAICSQKGYQRLTDTFHTDEYRMAVYTEGLEIKPIKYNTASQFNIVFECKPQRFLTSGEEAIDMGEIQDEVGANNTTYLFRASPQLGDYNAEQDTLVGGTVAWNQSVKVSDVRSTSTLDGITFTNNGDGSLTVNGTATNTSTPAIASSVSVTSGHVYALLSGQTSLKMYIPASGGWTAKANDIKKITASATGLNIIASYANGDSFSNVKVYPQLIDLTQMFGSTVADYIYSLETANAGAGVAWFKKLFPKPYYAYNAGELKSVSGLVSHDMTGFNQWDEDWESGSFDVSGNPTVNLNCIRTKNFVPCLPNTTYFWKSPENNGNGFRFYDKDKNFVSGTWKAANSLVTTPPDAYYLKFDCYISTYENNICLNLAWDNTRNGEYEPYIKHSYALDDSLTLRGIPKLDSANNLYYDGDTYEPDGTVTRKYGVVDLGTLTWNKEDSSTYRFYTYNLMSTAKSSAGEINPLYIDSFPSGGGTNQKVSGFDGSGIFFVRDHTYSTASDFKTAMSGVYLVYELATTTTEEAEPYTTPQICDPSGTEEYVSTGIVPVGHLTKYGTDPRQLVNPTLFEASPMLEVTGYGNIGINDDTITVVDAPLGEILISNESTQTVTLNTANVNTGDAIYKKNEFEPSITIRLTCTKGLYKVERNGIVTGASVILKQVSPDTYLLTVSPKMDNFYKGTNATITVNVPLKISYTNGDYPSAVMSVSLVYNASNETIALTTNAQSFPSSSDVARTYSKKFPAFYADSSKTALPSPMYIDLDLGEAYGEVGGSILSFNRLVTMPAKLPTLKTGTNTISYGNTVTALEVIPRWWKI